jgi:hypothetical protein
MFVASLTVVLALAASGYLGASAFADSGTTTTTTTGTTTTVSSVPAPAPDPAPTQTHHPAQKPAATHKAAKRSAPAPPAVVQPSVASTPSVAPVRPAIAPAHRKAVRKVVRHKRHAAKKKPATKPASRAKAPAQAPAKPRVQPAKPVSSSGGIWSPLFLVTLAILIAVVALTILRSRGSGAATSWIPRWFPVPGIFGRSPREVVAEVVQAPPPLPKPPARLPAAPTAPPVGSATRREPGSPAFNPEILLRPSTTTTESSVSFEVQQYEKATTGTGAHAGGAVDEFAAETVDMSTDDLGDGGAAFVPEAPPQPERCEIALWRGYAKARFFAKLTTGSGEYAYAVAESRPFRTRRNGTVEQTERTEAAHRSLVEFLRSEGWEQADHPDGAWYASRFERPVAARDASVTGGAAELVRT